MAASWILGKVMGKNNEAAGSAAAAAALEIQGAGEPGDCRSCFQRSSWRWIVTVVVSLQLLLFVLFMLGIGRNHHNGKILLTEAPFMFTFKLQRSASVINKYKSELEANLSSHIPSSNMKVTLLSAIPTDHSRYAEVRVQLLPDSQSYNESAVKKSLVKFFLQERNISLTPTTFGQVYDFQINKFPGGLSIVPGRSQKSLKRSSMFNFTLPNSTISEVSSHFRIFKKQLVRGICLRHNETLIAGLTNINGSTVEPPVIIQVSVFPSGGRHLSKSRVKQLAWKVLRHRKNLGLNHTLFGSVKNIQLSWELDHVLGRDRAPSPAPSRAPGPAPLPGVAAHEYTDYGGYGHSPELFYPGGYNSPASALAPAPASVYSIQTGFAKSPDFVAAASDPRRQVGGGNIASVPAGAPSPNSSSSWYMQRISAVGIVLLATAIALLL